MIQNKPQEGGKLDDAPFNRQLYGLTQRREIVMNRRFLHSMPVVVLLLVLAGCTSLIDSVDTTYNRSVDFAALETYGWWAIQGLADTDAQDVKSIRSPIDKDLLGKGLRMVEENPDFKVVVLLRKARQEGTSEVRKSWTGWQFDQSAPVYWGGPAAWSYEEGTMVIDLVRPRTNHMVWRGTAKTDLKKVKTPEERTEFIEKAVRMIMAKFPPT